MPVVQRDDVVIHYEEHGSGFPVLALAPGGMHSTASYCRPHPPTASRLLASSVPGARLVERWKEPEHLPAATKAIAAFLAE